MTNFPILKLDNERNNSSRIFVADISFSGPKIPSIGETILGKKYNVGPGGKGCNQAIAIARLGGVQTL